MKSSGSEETRALCERLEPWREPLFLCACARLRRYEDAQDVVASTFLQACLHLGSLRRPEQLRAWLFAILHNEIRQLVRRSAAPSSRLTEDLPDADSALAQLEVRLDLQRALAQIPIDQRRSAALYYLGGLSTAEIARELRRPEGTIRRWLHLARGRLAAGMQGYEARRIGMKAAFFYTDLDEGIVRTVDGHLRGAGYTEVVVEETLPSVTLLDTKNGGSWQVPDSWTGVELFVLQERIAGRSALELVPLLKRLGEGDPPRVIVLATEMPPQYAVFAYWSAGADGLLTLPLEGDELERCARKRP